MYVSIHSFIYIYSFTQTNPLPPPQLSDALSRPTPPPPGQRPRHAHDDLALAESPEVDAHADDVVETRVGALV